jgi:DNA-binding transcriptional regulator YiaG
MDSKSFGRLTASLTQALEHVQGKRELRTTVLRPPPPLLAAREVRRLRDALHASQGVFARYLNVSTKLVQAWEAGRRSPEGPALLLLHLVAQDPALATRAPWAAAAPRRGRAA